jgi:hypothetical protein
MNRHRHDNLVDLAILAVMVTAAVTVMVATLTARFTL